MTFFCYIYSEGSEVPHMEALGCQTLDEALTRSRDMLGEHRATTRAELFDDDLRIAVIPSRQDALTPD